VGRAEERFGRGRTPVDQQLAPLAVRETESPHVHGFGAALGDHAPEAQVEPEATQRAQPSRQPMDLEIPLERLLANAPRRLSLCLAPFG
jgi:hypothetical protein